MASEAGFFDTKDKIEKGIIHDGCDLFQFKICPDLLLAAITAAAAAAFLALYMAITQARRRRKRAFQSNPFFETFFQLGT